MTSSQTWNDAISSNHAAPSILGRLFDDGDYEPILTRIFRSLDGSSLEACGLVCHRWRLFLQRFFQRQATQRRLTNSWRSGVAASRRIQLDGRFLAMRADATSVVVGMEDGHVELWERVGAISDDHVPKWSSSPPYKRLSQLEGHTDLVRAVDLSPKWLLSGSWDSGIRLWRRDNGKCVANAYYHSAPVTGVVLRESHGQVISASRDGTMRRAFIVKLDRAFTHDHYGLKLDDNFCLEHGDSIIDISADGDRLLSGGSDARLVLWSIKEANQLRVMKGHGNGIRCVFLRGSLAMSGSRDKTAKLWDVETGQVLRTIRHTVDVRAVAFNSRAILTGDDYTDMFMWDMNKCSDESVSDKQSNDGLLLRTVTGHNGLVHSIQCIPSGLISCDVTGLLIERDFWACVEEGPSLRILRCQEGVNCMTCDSQSIVCGLLNKGIAVYDRRTLDLVRTMTGHNDHIWSVDMTDRLIASGSWDGSVKIWQRSNGNLIYSFRHPHEREISGVRISRDAKLVYISSLAGSLAILKVGNGEPDLIPSFSLVRMIPCQKDLGEIYSMAVDDKYMLTGHTLASTSLQLWSLDGESLESVSVIRENTSESIIWNLHLAFPLALVCRDNETLDIYHLETHSCLKSLRHESKVLNATLHKGIIVVGCQYGLLAFWHLQRAIEATELVIDINHSSCIKILSEHSGAIANVHIDNEELITDDYDGVVILRKMRSHSELKDVFLGRT